MSLASELIQRVKLGTQGVAQQIGSAQEFVRKHPVTSAVGVGGGVLATGGIIQIIRKARKKSSKPKKLSRKRTIKRTKKSKVSRRGGKRQRQPYTAGKGKDTSTRRIRFTKNNQPYVILRSGKARFIKKSSVARMRKRKGGNIKMAVVVAADATLSTAAYTKTADLVEGQYQNVGKGKIILVVYPSAIGMQATLSVGGITIVNDMPIPWFGTTGSMDLSAHVLVSQAMNGGKIEFYLRNTTVGALTTDYQLMFEPA